MFAREASSSEAIQNAVADVILYQIDCEKGEGPEIAKKFDVQGYPTFYAVNGTGEIIDRWIGYAGADAWARTVNCAKGDRRTLTEKKAVYALEPTAALALCLANDAATGSDYSSAVAYFKKARELDVANADQYTQSILENMLYGSRDESFTFEEVSAEANLVLHAAATTPSDRIQVASMIVQVGRQLDKLDESIPFLIAGLAAAEGLDDESVARTVKSLQVDHALLVEKNTDKAATLRQAMMPEGWQDDPKRLNQYAWWCFENNVNLLEAEAFALRGVELAADDGERANYLDTAAEICNKLGNCEDAIARIKQAIALAPDRDFFKEQLAKFEGALKEKKG